MIRIDRIRIWLPRWDRRVIASARRSPGGQFERRFALSRQRFMAIRAHTARRHSISCEALGLNKDCSRTQVRRSRFRFVCGARQ
jgi:hypothetical protein